MSASIDVHNVKRIDLSGINDTGGSTVYRVLEVVLEDGSIVQFTLFAADSEPTNLVIQFQ